LPEVCESSGIGNDWRSFVKRILSVSAAATLVVAAIMSGPAQAASKGTFGRKAGYNGIRIHMTLKQAKATHKLKPARFSGPCMHTDFKKIHTAVGVLISKRYGVVGVGAPKKARTPHGIGVGSTLKQVKKAYPKLKIGINFSSVRVPGYKTVLYGFQPRKGKVAVMWLMARTQDCAN
jgi:hypothetical protein